MGMFSQLSQLVLLAEKVLFVIGSLVYLVFALVVVKQVSMMNKNIYDKFNQVLILFSYVHLGFAIFLVILTLVSL
jgi:hypothetical protein